MQTDVDSLLMWGLFGVLAGFPASIFIFSLACDLYVRVFSSSRKPLKPLAERFGLRYESGVPAVDMFEKEYRYLSGLNERALPDIVIGFSAVELLSGSVNGHEVSVAKLAWLARSPLPQRLPFRNVYTTRIQIDDRIRYFSTQAGDISDVFGNGFAPYETVEDILAEVSQGKESATFSQLAGTKRTMMFLFVSAEYLAVADMDQERLVPIAPAGTVGAKRLFSKASVLFLAVWILLVLLVLGGIFVRISAQ